MKEKESGRRSWSKIVLEEQHWHPHLTAQDVHKLIHQGCYGADHLLGDDHRYRENLAQEWAALPAGGVRHPLLQVIHPSGRVARLHLAACKQLGMSIETVSRLLLGQPLRHGQRESFAWAWACVIQSARSQDISIPIEDLLDVQPDAGVGHHSPNYGPAFYRVLNDLGHGPTREALGRWGIFR